MQRIFMNRDFDCGRSPHPFDHLEPSLSAFTFDGVARISKTLQLVQHKAWNHKDPTQKTCGVYLGNPPINDHI